MSNRQDRGDLPQEFKTLSPRHQKFVLGYLEHHNATRAAKEAGFSEKSADTQGFNLTKNPKIKAIIELMRNRDQTMMAEKYDVTRERVTQELAKVAFANMGRIVRWSGNTFIMQEHAETSEQDTAAIKSISYSTSESQSGRSESFNLSMYDKVKALELLGKSLGMFEDDTSRDTTASDALKERMAAIRDKMLGRGPTGGT